MVYSKDGILFRAMNKCYQVIKRHGQILNQNKQYTIWFLLWHSWKCKTMEAVKYPLLPGVRGERRINGY